LGEDKPRPGKYYNTPRFASLLVNHTLRIFEVKSTSNACRLNTRRSQ
jgi:predicted transcriptional regulator